MRGPIDYIIVGFDGNKFDGSILSALGEAIDSGIIRLIDLSLVAKAENGDITVVNIADTADDVTVEFTKKYNVSSEHVTQEDVDEIADLLEPNTAAGLLVIEQLWAKPLKQAIINAGSSLIAEGRIHPEAAEELNNESEGGK